MKKTQILLFLVFTSLIATSCTKWNQDPLKDKDNSVKDGTQAPTIPQKPDPLDQNAVKIDSVDSYNFEEDKLGEFTVQSRVWEPGYTVRTEIINIDEFPGAVFDGNTGQFTWKPAIGFVPGGLPKIDTKLQIRAIAEKADVTILRKVKEIQLQISKAYQAPKIISVGLEYSWNTFREGGSTTIVVTVEDEDATDDKNTWPNLFISNVQDEKSLAAFMTLTDIRRSYTNAGQLEYRVEVDLKDAEVTKSHDLFKVSFQAYSRQNKGSIPTVFPLDVFNKLGELSTTWTNRIEIAAGSKLDYQFLIFDPKAEGEITTPPTFTLPTGATATCQKLNISMQQCRVQWQTVASTDLKVYKLSAFAVMSSAYSQDTTTSSKYLYYEVKVVPPPPPPPFPEGVQ